MNAISLFSGVGGFEIGLQRAGIRTVLQCEIDPVALSVLRRHWPDVPKVEDVRTLTAESVRQACSITRSGQLGGGSGFTDIEHLCNRGSPDGCPDLVYGGFPCQGMSAAGQRAGLRDERSVLWFEFHRVVSELRPRWVVVENVFGARSFPADFATILTGLSDLGYGVAWRELDAQFFSVPQRRRRIFWVATRDTGDGSGARRAAEVLALCEGCGRDSAASGIAQKRATRRVKARAGMGSGASRSVSFGTIPIQDGREIIKSQNGLGVADEGDPAYTVDGIGAQAVFVFETRVARNGRGQPSDIVPPLKAQSGRAGSGDGAPVLAFVDVAANLRGRESSQGIGMPGRGGEDDANLVPVVSGPLGSVTGGVRSTDLDGMGAYVPSYWDGGQLAPDTLDVSMLTKGQMMPDKRRMAVVICNGLRRLMPIEAERIMGWPSDWTKWRDDGSEIPDTHRYRLIGNGVVSTVAEWIGYRLMAADAETRA